MAKMVGKAAPVSGYIGKSAVGNSAKAAKLMDGSKVASSSKSGPTGGIPKPSRTKHGSSFIFSAKKAD